MCVIVGQGPEKMRHGALKTEHGTQGGCTRLVGGHADKKKFPNEIFLKLDTCKFRVPAIKNMFTYGPGDPFTVKFGLRFGASNNVYS